MTQTLDEAIENIREHTDLNPWYWLSGGEKDYVFACVSAFPLDASAKIPKGGTQLVPHLTKKNIWIAEDGTEMIIDESIATIERQNGDVICQFISIAHTELVKTRELNERLPIK